MIRCFANWHEDEESNLCFRSNTILQFGKSWNLLANFILLNPGSAKPIKTQCRNISSINQWYISPDTNSDSFTEFEPDNLMKKLVSLFGQSKEGGVIRIYNLFNMKNSESAVALSEYKKHLEHPMMFTPFNDIDFGNAPVLIASGRDVKKHDALRLQLKTYVSKLGNRKLYYLSQVENGNY